jgi:cytochrome b561
MQWKSSPQTYGALPITLHWVSALAVLIMLASGLAAVNTPDAAAKIGILRVHVSTGLCVLVLTVLRIVWWLFIDRKPEPKAGVPGWQSAIARVVHYGMYVVIVVMLASGIALAILSGLVPMLFGAPGSLPNFQMLPPFLAHGLGAWALMGLIVLHTLAALYHQFIRRDQLLARMGIGAN